MGTSPVGRPAARGQIRERLESADFTGSPQSNLKRRVTLEPLFARVVIGSEFRSEPLRPCGIVLNEQHSLSGASRCTEQVTGQS